jgi:hypothetical protein
VIRTRGVPRAFGACFISLLALALFFLVRPALSAGPYYGPRPPETTYAYWYLVVGAFVPYALILRACLRGDRPALPLALGGAAVLYLILIPAPALQSQDVYQYLTYGNMAAEGANPYVPSVVPGAWETYTLWDATPTVYGPVWTVITSMVVTLTGGTLVASLLLMKALTAGLALSTAFLLASAVDPHRDRPEEATFAAVAFAYNPLVLVATGLGAHADVAVAAAFAGAAVASRKGKDGLVTFLLVAATLVKAYAGLVLLVWLVVQARGRGARTGLNHGVGAVILMVLAFLPFWEGLRTFSGFADVGRLASASLFGTIERLAAGGINETTAAVGSPVGPVVRVVGGAILVAAFLFVARSDRTVREPWRAGAIVMALYVLVTPWYLYWHLIGPLALVIVAADRVLFLAAATFSASSLVVAAGSTLNGPAADIGLIGQTLLRYGPPVTVLLTRRLRDGLDPSRPSDLSTTAGTPSWPPTAPSRSPRDR